MVKTSKQKTQIKAHHKIAESAKQTHTQKQTKEGYDAGRDRPLRRSWLTASQTTVRSMRSMRSMRGDECGHTIIRAIRHEARSSGLGDGSSNLYPVMVMVIGGRS
jgi:hypothetical protein